jgi:hypothetical protein
MSYGKRKTQLLFAEAWEALLPHTSTGERPERKPSMRNSQNALLWNRPDATLTKCKGWPKDRCRVWR